MNRVQDPGLIVDFALIEVVEVQLILRKNADLVRVALKLINAATAMGFDKDANPCCLRYIR